jgi:hypothetical protein
MLKSARFFAFILCVFLKANAQVNTIYPSSSIEKVTVYLNGAQVTRQATVQLEAGKNELIFKGLSPSLDKETVQFSTDKGVTIFSVSFREPEENTDLNATQKSLLNRIGQLRSLNSMDSLDLSILASQEDALFTNKEFGKYSDLKPLEFRQNMDFYGQKMEEFKKAQARIKKKMSERLDSIRTLIKNIDKAGYKPITSGDVLVLVGAGKSEKITVFLNYYVSNAGWMPSYDFRVKSIKDPMILKWKATLFQATGESWNKVNLSLSNSNPRIDGTVPVLKPWYVNLAPPQLEKDKSEKNEYLTIIRGQVLDQESSEPIPYASVRSSANPNQGTFTDIQGKFTLSLQGGAGGIEIRALGFKMETINDLFEDMKIFLSPENKKLEEVQITGKPGEPPFLNGSAGVYGKRAKRAALKTRNRQISRFTIRKDQEDKIPVVKAIQAPVSVSFEIKEPYSIPENGKKVVVDISEIEINPDFQYVAVPKIDQTVFLTAQITDWENLNLLPGNASIYFENNFVGNTELKPDGNEDTLVLSLGFDRQVSISRTRVKANSKKSFLGSNRFVTREFEIKVKNNKSLPIPVMVYDQLPLSTLSEIEINTKKLEGDPEVNATTGKLLWKFKLDPKEEKKFKFGYEVKFGANHFMHLE